MGYDVIIDAGHSKLTAGKRSFDNSFYEYEFNFDVANKIKKHLDRHNVSSMVLQVEASSANSEIGERLRIIKEQNPKIVVSIHANAFGNDWNNAMGWEIYSYKNVGESLKLAQAIYRNTFPLLDLRNRGIKGNSVSDIVDKTSMPAVLVEHGFYTNKTELEKLKSQDFREKCAIADAKGILEYLKIEWKDGIIEDILDKLYRVQVGAFSSKKNADNLVNELIKKGYNAIVKEG